MAGKTKVAKCAPDTGHRFSSHMGVLKKHDSWEEFLSWRTKVDVSHQLWGLKAPGEAITVDQPPYHLKAFNVCINFPQEYPFKPPTIKFTTKIYHPNVDENGQVCLPIISNENWKPCTKTCQVLEALNVLVNRPNMAEPLRVDLADLLTQNPELFRKNAEEFTLRFGVDRPS
ncbi:Ubiquitin/ISG15-conjugating enzyme E2 L6 [Saguinus oedipus]|uniref:Ubiquitin/ISG15-conjugating enzyme E2 L6 n=1 Tax=Saguinus oedipus TaxID=9490 RepID=A0ABQ9UTL3_SAGOE|nr:Ubiquitin/ISG15-conjugating enzyme E2 L6 [Saguinus oedipus]